MDPELTRVIGAAEDVEGARRSKAAPRRLSYRGALLLALALAAATWIPRLSGPIDLRWDGGVYYLLGTSLAQGTGYRLLNEPGEIQADQYPPLLPIMIAAHEKVLGTSDVQRVGVALRMSALALFLIYAWLVFRFFASRLSPGLALLGTALSILTIHVYFVSDSSLPEVPFSICILLFVSARRRDNGGVGGVWPYVYAVLAYALRTAGIAALAAWVAESVFAARFRQAAFRAALAALPIVAWQSYVAAVESSEAYRHPAYAYQRAAYMFYNVSYGKNITLRDPSTPEKGPITPFTMAKRVAHNALTLPTSLAETVTTARGYFEMPLYRHLTDRQASTGASIVVALLFCAGWVVIAGLALGAVSRERLTPLFVAAYLGTLCLAPFPDQFLRYLMPVTPMLVAAVMRLRRRRFASAAAVTVLGVAVAAKLAVATEVFAFERQPASYENGDRTGSYRLFFYDAPQQDFDRTIDYVNAHADRGDVVAAGTPHRIYLRTGLKSVMPPFEADRNTEQAMLDSVPVAFLIVGHDVIRSERYVGPVVESFPELWTNVFTSPGAYWSVYRRSPLPADERAQAR